MADGTTPNLSLILPEVGQSADTWGTKTNSNWITVDIEIHNRLLLAGGTLTGNLVMNNDTKLQWKDTTGTVRDHMYVGTNNNLNIINGTDGTKILDQPEVAELARIDNNGCVGLYGRTTGSAPTIQSLYATAFASTPQSVQAATGDGNIILQNSNNLNRGKLQWMHTDGRVYDHIYVGPASYLYFVSGGSSAGFRWNNVGETLTVASMDNAGNFTCRTVAQTSDYRLKNVHGVAHSVGDTLDRLTVFDAAWKEAPDDRHPMLLAHVVEDVCPWAVTGTKDAVDEAGRIAPQSVDYAGLVPMLIAEIQALRRRVATLEHAAHR